MGEAYKRDRRTSAGRVGSRRVAATGPADPANARDRRAQGTETRVRLLDAGLAVFAERGYHAARVDDIVRAAETSHGTFYLYFANKEELLRDLATVCAADLRLAASALQTDGASPASLENRNDALGEFVAAFMAAYARYGPVIRAWMEDQMGDSDINRMGVRVFTDIADALGERLAEADALATPARVGALMALLERVAYYAASGRLDAADPAMISTVTTVVRRGFFASA
ncbi:MAG TPA: TetR/AcrR family transcriptional regulator [Acidimicrobiia bacterium]|jgi:AcrR family transcriptional regulator